jgi:hypothetical protein
MWARFGDGRFHALKPRLSIKRDNAQNAHGRGFESNRLIYKRGCQEHFSPYAGGADLFRDIQPLSPWKTVVWCPALGCSIAVAASSLVATTPISFETH